MDKAYGASRLASLSANLKDRWQGLSARANARAGYLRAPAGEGKLVWIKAGGTRDAVRLGAELMGALRQKRQDIRLVLTFEQDYADLLEPRVRGLRKIGLGYGPSDVRAVTRRVMGRLQPFGLILADTLPHANLLQQARAAGTHLIAFNTEPSRVPVSAAYPLDARQHQAWLDAGTAQYLAPAADCLSLFTEAQADITLKSLINGPQEFPLWWWHGPADQTEAVLAQWRASGLCQQGLLLVSTDFADLAQAPWPGVALRISRWQREPLAVGQVLWVDQADWLAPVASAVNSVHLACADRQTLWAALAGGAPLSASSALVQRFASLEAVVPLRDTLTSVFDLWHNHVTDVLAARRLGDAGRRVFWDERRRVQRVSEEFAQRVYDW